jgi:RNA polymerase sigma-70 factor, ECF subfamily
MDLSQIAALRMEEGARGIESSSDREGLERTLERAQAGDRGAFDAIITLHQRRVVMTAWRLLGRLEDAEDAAQEVFLRLFRCLNRFDGKRDLAPWLYRMTVNVCHDVRRKRERTSALSIHEVRTPSAATTVRSDADENILEAERRSMMEAGLATLAEKERAAIVLRDIEGLSTKEVARILGSSETTVRSQISVARVKIKRFIDREGLDLRGRS